MTGGGDLDETVHEELAEELDEAEDVVDGDADELGGEGDGEADAPVGVDLNLNDNDPDPTAGASDIGGLPGGIDGDTGP